MSTFRVFVWDPTLLVSQILSMQTIFYTVEAACLILYSSVSSYEANLSTIYSLQVSRGGIIIQLIASIISAIALSIIVQRAKQCLDFACTLHVIHCIISFVYSRGISMQFTWWILQIVSTTVLTILGEYMSMRVESQEIRLGQPSKYDL